MIKLIALDLDGTLLNSQHEISPRNHQTLQKAMENGIKIALVSGRNFPSIQQFVRKLQGASVTASMNGSSIFDHSIEREVFDQRIDSEISSRILGYTEQMDIHTNYYHEDHIVCPMKNDHSRVYSRNTGEPVVDIGSLLEYNKGKSPNKLLLIGEHFVLDQARVWLEDNVPKHINHFYSNPNYLEVVHHSVSKGAAIQWMAKYFGLSMNQVMAFGDAENDISMIRAAGLGVAMANAPELVKNAADYVTSSNDEDGVAQAIEHLIRDGS